MALAPTLTYANVLSCPTLSDPTSPTALSAEKPSLLLCPSTVAPVDLTLVPVPKEAVLTLPSLSSPVQSPTTPAIIKPVTGAFFSFFSSCLFSNSLLLESTTASAAIPPAFPSLLVPDPTSVMAPKTQHYSIAIQATGSPVCLSRPKPHLCPIP